MRDTEREALAARVLAAAGGDLCEAIVTDHDLGLTRFTQNAIHQNVAQRDTTVRVRIVADARTGVAQTNLLDDASLRATVERARAMAALAPRDETRADLAQHAAVAAPAGAFVTATAEATPERRAAIAAELIAASERAGLWAAGYVTTARSGITVANSLGTRSSFDGTSCGLNVKANGADATGFAERYSTDVADLDGAFAGAVAAEKALRGANPRAVEPGSWTVILEPAAFGELLSYLTDHFSAQSVSEGSSFLSEAPDGVDVGANVSIADDVTHALNPGMPFDYEGAPKHVVPLVERGRAHGTVTDTTWAKRLGVANTGHGLPAPSAAGPEAEHVVVAPGDASLEELVARTRRGLLISRFWYIRPVDQRKTIVTGMTRDGTFLIENGELRGGVRNLRFNQSILEALRHAAFGDRLARTGGYSYATVVPAARIEGFRFTSVTDF
jgi:PmbA protein